MKGKSILNDVVLHVAFISDKT